MVCVLGFAGRIRDPRSRILHVRGLESFRICGSRKMAVAEGKRREGLGNLWRGFCEWLLLVGSGRRIVERKIQLGNFAEKGRTQERRITVSLSRNQRDPQSLFF